MTAVAVTLIYLFPPWNGLHPTEGFVTHHLGFAWRWSPPNPPAGWNAVVAVDQKLLWLEFIATAVCAAAAVWFIEKAMAGGRWQ